MENNKHQENSKINPNNIKNAFNNSNQNKAIRSKSKNIYPQKKNYKIPTQNKYFNPKPSLNSNNNVINNCHMEKQETPSQKNNFTKKNSQNEQKLNKYDLIELKLLSEENIAS